MKGLESKLAAMHLFLERLLESEVGSQIARVIHYGSTLRGDWHEESDVDLLVVAAGNVAAVDQVCTDLSFEIMMEVGELIQPMVYCIDAYRAPRLFPHQVRRTGKEVFALKEAEILKKEANDLLGLARDYLATARTLTAPEHRRLAIDGGYNAAELCAKGFLLLQGSKLPRTHSGIITRFGELIVKPGLVPEEVGRRLHRAFVQRNNARYDPHAVLTQEQATEVLELAQALIQALEGRLAGS